MEGERDTITSRFSEFSSQRVRRSIEGRINRLRERRIVDCRADGVDALSALRTTRWGVPLVDIPLDRLRQYSNPTPLVDLERNPFSRLARQLIDAYPDVPDTTALHELSSTWQPKDAAHVYLGRPSTLGVLDTLPPTPDCLPWGTFDSVEAIRQSVAAHEERQIRRFGHSKSGRHGFRSFGPHSDAALAAYLEEYRSLVASILESGYQEGLNGYPTVQLLIDGDHWSARLLGGNHRCAVLAALEHATTPVLVAHRTIQRNQSDRWSGTRLGIYTHVEAMEVLSRFVGS